MQNILGRTAYHKNKQNTTKKALRHALCLGFQHCYTFTSSFFICFQFSRNVQIAKRRCDTNICLKLFLLVSACKIKLLLMVRKLITHKISKTETRSRRDRIESFLFQFLSKYVHIFFKNLGLVHFSMMTVKWHDKVQRARLGFSRSVV